MAATKPPYVGQSVLYRPVQGENPDPSQAVIVWPATVTAVAHEPTGYVCNLTIFPDGLAPQFATASPYSDFDTGDAESCFRNRNHAAS